MELFLALYFNLGRDFGEYGRATTVFCTPISHHPSCPSLSSPADQATAQPTTIRLSWDLMEEADEYQIQLSQTENFSSVDQAFVTPTHLSMWSNSPERRLIIGA